MACPLSLESMNLFCLVSATMAPARAHVGLVSGVGKWRVSPRRSACRKKASETLTINSAPLLLEGNAMVDFTLPLEPGQFYIEGSEMITLFKKGKAKGKAKQPPETETEPGDDGFVRAKPNGPISPGTPLNVRLAINLLGVKLKQNEFSDQIEIEGLPRFGPELTDAAAIRLRFMIDETYKFLPTDEIFKQVLVDLAYRERYHPVRDYLDGLVWDEKPRVDDWLVKYGGAEDTPFNRAVGKLFLIAAVRRVRQPGCKFDTVLILESSEGKNKSSALAIMAVRAEWFSDNMVLGADAKEVIEQSGGVWIMEISELAGINSRDIEKIKSFTSRQADRARKAYGRLPERVKRQTVYAGTTNEFEYLGDGEHRRFWPVRVKLFKIVELMGDRDQIWAEANRLEKQGESIVLDEKLWEAAADVRAVRKIGNPIAEKLAWSLKGLQGWIRSKTVWDHLDVPVERRSRLAKSVGQSMRALGFEVVQERARLGGKVEYGERYYVRGEGVERDSEITSSKLDAVKQSASGVRETATAPDEIGRDDIAF
jgi:hypothetical protein